MAIYSTGLGFMQGWLWLFFLNGPLLYVISAKWGYQVEKIFIVFMLFHSLSYLLTANLAPSLSPLKEKRLVLVISAILSSLGPLALSVTAGGPSLLQINGLIVLVSIASGFGAAFVISAWGEHFSSLEVRYAGLSYGGAVVIGTVLFFIQMYASTTIAMALLSITPLLSLWFLFTSRNQNAPDGPALLSPQTRSFPLPRRLAVLVILFYLFGGFMQKIVYTSSTFPIQDVFWLTNIIYCAVTLIAGASIFYYPNLDLRLIYRPVLPCLGAGFILFAFLHNALAIAPFTLLQAGFALFDTYTWLLLVYLASRHRFPAVVVGWGMFLITFSIFVGEIVSTAIPSILATATKQADIVAVVATILALIATMVFRDKPETFAGWEASAGSIEAVEDRLVYSNIVDTPVIEELKTAPANIDLPQPETSIEEFLSQYNLTDREKEIMLLLLGGRNNPYIREKLNISNNTLKTHLRNAYQKLSVSNRQELITVFNESSN